MIKRIFNCIVSRKIYLILFPIALLILEMLPSGAILKFGQQNENGDISFLTQTTSYFDFLPFGYANFGPLITAFFTLVLIVLFIVYFFVQRKYLFATISYISFITFLTNLLPLIYGIDYFSIIAFFISLILLALIVIMLLLRKQIK